MAVFVAAADETDDPNHKGLFVFGGFVAPFVIWQEWFAPAWEERVLNRPPVIPYLHMTDIRSAQWRNRHGLTLGQAEAKTDEAVNVIRSTGELFPLVTAFESGHFRRGLGKLKIIRHDPQPGTYAAVPDYGGFSGFALGALEHVSQNYPGAEKVDFVVERKTGVTQYFDVFLDGLRERFPQIGLGHLVPLIGEVIPGGKERVPLQAADVLLWHLQRREKKLADRTDMRRLKQMLDGRAGTVLRMSPEQLDEARQNVTTKYPAPRPFVKKRSLIYCCRFALRVLGGFLVSFGADKTRRKPAVNCSIARSGSSARMSGMSSAPELREGFFSTFAVTPHR